MSSQKASKVFPVLCIAIFTTALAACSKDEADAKLQIPSTTVEKKVDQEQCVSDWIDAFRKEKGDEEAPVNEDMVIEWETWCKKGKTPDK
jgi:hypothetical protein